MKSFIPPTLFLALTFGCVAQGASGGPDAAGYTWVDQDEADGTEFLSIGGTANQRLVLTHNDPESVVLTLDRPWGGIYGQKRSQIVVSRHGYISLDLADPGTDHTNDCLPAVPDEAASNLTRLYVAHQNLIPGATMGITTGFVTYEYFPESPHPHHGGGVHLLEWSNWGNDTQPGADTQFQVLLFDNLDIIVQFNDVPNGGNFTTGIQNHDATVGLEISCSNTPLPTERLRSYLIRPPLVTVTTYEDQLDSPAGPELSLREAIRDATSGSRIVFDVAETEKVISLGASGGGQDENLLISDKVLAISGSPENTAKITLTGEGETRHLTLAQGAWVHLDNLGLHQGDTAGEISGGGGSIRLAGDATLIAQNCRWESNDSAAKGGALVLLNASSTYLRSCEFYGNESAQNGGAVYLSSGSTLEATECRFWRNRAMESPQLTGFEVGNGGAIALFGGKVQLDSCDLAINEASDRGGTIFMSDGSELLARRTAFDDNRGRSGGAFCAEVADPQLPNELTAAFERCTFYQNSASEEGGAFTEKTLRNNASTGEFSFDYCTILENAAGIRGGAFRLQEAVIPVLACVLANNTVGHFDDQISNSGLGRLDATPGFNYSSNSEGVFGAFNGESNQEMNYLPLGYYGGSVRTAPLLPDSPGVDGGPLVVFQDGVAIDRDARGLPVGRDIDGGSDSFNDVGAVELGPVVTVTSSADSGAGTLREAFDLVSDGGVIRFEGVHRISLASPLSTFGDSHEDFAILIDGSDSDGITIDGRFLSSAGRQWAYHRVNFIRSANNTITSNENSGSLTLSHCRISLFEGERFAGVGLGGAASFLNCQFEHGKPEEEVVRVTSFSRGFQSTLFCRDTLFQNNLVRQDVNSPTVVRNSGMSIFQRCSFVGNTIVPTSGSASLFQNTNQSFDFITSLLLENSTFAQNEIVEVSGGPSGTAIVNAGNFVAGAGIDIKVDHCTFLENQARQTSSRILLVSTSNTEFSFANSVFSGNKIESDVVSAGLTSLGGNLTDDDPSAFGSQDSTEREARLSPLVLGTNGTLHAYPRRGSPCIDAALGESKSGQDGRGSLRSILQESIRGQSFAPDIGAAESGQIYVIDTATDEENGINGGAGVSLRELVSISRAQGPVLASYDQAVHDQEHVITASLLMTNNQLDIDGLESGVTIRSTIPAGGSGAAEEVFRGSEGSVLSLSGLRLVDNQGMVAARDESVATLNHCYLTGDTDISLLSNSYGQMRLADSHVEGLDVTGRGLQAIGEGHFEMYRSAVTRCSVSTLDGYKPLVDIPSRATGSIVDSTFAHNPVDEVISARQDGQLFLDRTTVARNGNAPVNADGDDSVFFVRDSIISNNFGDAIFAPRSIVTSLGGNLSEKPDPGRVFGGYDSDLACRATFLAPLADYTGDGIPEMPPLAASPAFNRRIGGAAPPSEVIVVTTTEDDLSSSTISLRDALNQVMPGGTIIFDKSLKERTLTVTSANQSLPVPSSVTIDATSLLRGIDFQGRLQSVGSGITLALHGVHLRDTNTDSAEGGLLRMEDGALIASQCSFTGGTLSGGGPGAALWAGNSEVVVENCTFAENVALDGAVVLVDCFARISHSTFAENRDDSAVLLASGSDCEVLLFANVFSDNLTFTSVFSSGGASVVSLGENGFPDSPIITLATSDTVNLAELANGSAYPSLEDDGGFVASYLSTFGSSGQVKMALRELGQVPFPLIDSRGYPRVAGTRVEWGGVEAGSGFVDSDNDDIPDYWENYYGLNPKEDDDAEDDPDDDGRDNLTEFNNGTDPFFAETAAAATIVSAEYVPNMMPGIEGFRVNWIGEDGQVYQFERSEDLITWGDAPGGLAEGTGALTFTTFVVPTTPARYFYRIYPTEAVPD